MTARLKQLAVQTLGGISQKKVDLLRTLGVETIYDLLFHFPFRHEDQNVKPLLFAADGEKITIVGQVVSAPSVKFMPGGKSLLRCKLATDDGMFHAVWFNRAYMRDHLQLGRTLKMTGKWDAKYRQVNVAEHRFVGAGDEESERTGGLTPVYSTVADLPQKWLRSKIEEAIHQYAAELEESLPAELVANYQFLAFADAVRQFHCPTDAQSLQAARFRLVYEEFFFYQLRLQAFRSFNKQKQDGIAHTFRGDDLIPFMKQLPFALTGAQQRVLREIMTDLRQPFAMNRLLQGDVGAGKTVVAAFSMYAVYLAGNQSVLMAPTEILAEQHYRSLQTLFAPFSVRVELLTGSTSEKSRRSLLAGLRAGEVHIIIGTHALLQDDVYFHQLGLIVTDEQHRFGVNQRAALRKKGLFPDVLSMTATPIPRTLAITVYGDLDVSILDEYPKGRKPIITKWLKKSDFANARHQLEVELRTGRQAYLICPLIEESDALDVQNAIDMYETLKKEWPDLKIGLLHGRMPASEKDTIMREFKENRVQLLVSTTVVEVGVDVPNATFMVIYDADRFGLSQLHQLRGRVGRGEHQSYCFLIADPSSDTGVQRMQIMCATNDGFELARKDLELRGTGDFFGTKQSGTPDFQLAQLTEDFAMLERARDDVARILADEHFWTSIHFIELRRYLQEQQIFAGIQLD